jgi:hypothetical protein
MQQGKRVEFQKGECHEANAGWFSPQVWVRCTGTEAVLSEVYVSFSDAVDRAANRLRYFVLLFSGD